jgi:hypothetical protein
MAKGITNLGSAVSLFKKHHFSSSQKPIRALSGAFIQPRHTVKEKVTRARRKNAVSQRSQSKSSRVEVLESKRPVLLSQHHHLLAVWLGGRLLHFCEFPHPFL